MRQYFNQLFIRDRKPVRKIHLFILIFIVLAIIVIYYPRDFMDPQRSILSWPITIFEFRATTFGLLFILPIIYAAIFLNTQVLIATWIICGVLMLPRVTDLSFHLDTVVRTYIVYTLPFFVAMFVKTEYLRRETERKSAAEKEEQRQKYLSQVFKAHENERKNIARELHDSVIQSLIVLTNQAQSIISNKNYDSRDQKPAKEANILPEQVVVLRDMSREISKDIRNICLDLRPYIIDDMGLIPALRWLINRTKTDIIITLTTDGIQRRFNPEIELMIYRIIQEAINNILHHSMATEANICFHFYSDSLQISIEDNGKGFVFPLKIAALTEEGKLGLIGMNERVKSLNGDIKIVSQIGRGTSILIDAAI
jgi:signal transduction histidine kinase